MKMETSVDNQKLIDQLPDEMLLKVFEKCDSDEIKNCCLVSSKWNTLIGQSLSVMEKLPLHLSGLSGSWLQILQETSNFNRKYHTIVIKGVNSLNGDTAKVLRKHGSESRCIKFDSCNLVAGKKTRKAIAKILKSSKNVESITFHSVNMNSDMHPAKMNSVEMPRLKSISLIKTSLSILDLFESSQLKSLQIGHGFSNGFYYRVFFHMVTFLKFLATQKSLEELALFGVPVSSDYFEGDLDDLERILERVEMPLKRLSLFFGESANRFLSHFAGTLEELELKGFYEDSIFETIFKEFRKLKVVMINVQRIPRNIAFYHNLRPNNSVKKLDICGSVVYNQRGLECLIGNMPNLETLALRKCTEDVPVTFMFFVSINLQHLSTLHLDQATGGMFDQVRMPSVKALSFQTFLALDVDDCNRVVSAFTNVETFSLQEIDHQSSISLNNSNTFPKCWPNLSHLKFGRGLTAKKRVFFKLLRNCKKIKTVEMAETDFKRYGSRDLKKEGLRFLLHKDIDIQKIFPENEDSLWINENLPPDMLRLLGYGDW